MSDNVLAYSPTLGLIDSHVAIYKIYILRNPINEEIFYVGQTKMPLEIRLSGHTSETGGSNRDKINYIKAILEAGRKPIIEAIETIATTCYIDTMAVNEREIYWIRYHKSLGCNLLNKAATAPDTKCKEFHGYLAAIKRRETSWHYYYCGKTAGGYSVYDEAKLKADGFILPRPVQKIDPVWDDYARYEHPYNPFEYDKYRLKVGLPVIERPEWKERVITEVFPYQPAWSAEFAKSIPPYNSLKVEMYFEMQVDNCDYEPEILELDDCDYESTRDEEPDWDNEEIGKLLYEPINWIGFNLSELVLPNNYYVAKLKT